MGLFENRGKSASAKGKVSKFRENWRYFLSKVVGRESRGDDLLGSERMNLRTSSEDTGWRTEIGVPENCLVGKDMGDEAMVLAMDS